MMRQVVTAELNDYEEVWMDDRDQVREKDTVGSGKHRETKHEESEKNKLKKV